MPHDAVVIGGGIAGLACAFELGRAGADVVVLEAEAAAGGNVRTHAVDGYRFERGPHTFLASADDVFALVAAAGAEGELVSTRPQAAARFIVRGGRLHAAPSGPLSFLTTGLLSWRGKLALAAEPWRSARGAAEDEPASAFFARRFGAEAGRVLAGAFINGVYAGDPERLSARAAFPLFWGFEREAGSLIRGTIRYQKRRAVERARAGTPRRRGLYSLSGGLGALPAALAARLGDRVRTGAAVRVLARDGAGWAVETDGTTVRAAQVVIATPPAAAGALLAGVAPAAARLVGATEMAPVAVVHLGFARRLAAVPEGFGFLAPRGEGVRSLGVLFPSRLFADRTPPGGELLTAFVGGTLDPQALELDDAALRDLVLADLAALLGALPAPHLVRVMRYPAAIPQLTQGHVERIAAAAAELGALGGIRLAGNYLAGVGLKDAAAVGRRAADAVLRDRAGAGR
jgi:oxygen-dependent protoporphyrinogen oxidase